MHLNTLLHKSAYRLGHEVHDVWKFRCLARFQQLQPEGIQSLQKHNIAFHFQLAQHKRLLRIDITKSEYRLASGKMYPLRIKFSKHEFNKILIFDSDYAVSLAISIWTTVDTSIAVALVFRG